jgi:hypothetical protein
VVPMVVPKPAPRSASNRVPNLVVCCSTRYSTASARWRTWPKCPYTFRTIASPRPGGRCRADSRVCADRALSYPLVAGLPVCARRASRDGERVNRVWGSACHHGTVEVQLPLHTN